MLHLCSHPRHYDTVGQLLSEDGPWYDDTVSYGYQNRLRTSLSLLAPDSSPWTESYGYDAAVILHYRTRSALADTPRVNAANELPTITRSGTLSVAGTTTTNATSVTVNSSAANRYSDTTFALGGFTLIDGNNPFTAVAQ